MEKKYFLAEEFLEGKEIGAQAFILNGELQFIIPHDDQLFYSNTGVPIGHSAPISLSTKLFNDIKKQIKLSVEALKLDNCALNIDFIIKNDLVYVLEIGARSGATCLSELVSTSFGFDYYKYIIDVSLGKMPQINKNVKIQPNASSLLFAKSSGVIKHINNKNNINDKDIIEIMLDYSEGQMVRKFEVGPDRIGHIIVKGKTLEEAKKKLQKTIKNIEIVVS